MSENYPPTGGEPQGQQPYGQQPHGQQPYGQSYGPPPGARPNGLPPGVELAPWISRVGASLIDFIIPGIPYGILYGIGLNMQIDGNGLGTVLILLAVLILIGFSLWNQGYKQGTTGASIGKNVLGIEVRKEADGQFLGTGLSIGRIFVHILDSIPCYLGYLWPLWDPKNRTFADMILTTLVVKKR